MGIRSRLKGAIKRAVLGETTPAGSADRATPAPEPTSSLAHEDPGRGNLAGGEEVPWYLQDGDPDGWDNTNAKDDLDED